MNVTKQIRRYLVLTGFALFLANCGGGTDLAGGNKSKKSDAGDSKEEAEGTSATEPAQVAGAFLDGLDCSYISGETLFGCTAYDDAGKRIENEGNSFNLQLFNDKNELVTMKSQAAPTTSTFHSLATLPLGYTTSGTLKMTITSISSGKVLQKSAPTKSIKKATATPLGNTAFDSDIGTSVGGADVTANPEITLKSFTVSGKWEGGQLGLIANAIIPADFCDPGGIVRQELSDSSQMMTKIFTDDGKNGEVNKLIQAGNLTIGAASTVCFTAVGLLFDSKSMSQFAQSGNGCLFVRVGTSIYIGKETQGTATVSINDLRKFAAAKACQ